MYDNKFKQFDADHEEREAAVASAPAQFHEVISLAAQIPGTILAGRDYYLTPDGFWTFAFASEATPEGRRRAAEKLLLGWLATYNESRQFCARVDMGGYGVSELQSLIRSLRRRFRINKGCVTA